MKYGIFGDIHGNIEAFKEVIEVYKKEDIDKYFCVGDIVGYGADPHQCIEEVKGLNAGTVCGNHDRASVGLFSTDYFNHAARQAVEWTQENLGADEKEFLKNLGLVIDEEDFTVVHGSMDRPEDFDYIIATESACRCFRKMEKNLCFVGHSHMPAVFFMKKDKVTHTCETFININPGIKYIVNVGSVGQARDGNPLAAYCIFDTDKATIETRRVRYDVEAAKNKILDAGLPKVLAYRLLEGR